MKADMWYVFNYRELCFFGKCRHAGRGRCVSFGRGQPIF
jgi:hypothetical protein